MKLWLLEKRKIPRKLWKFKRKNKNMKTIKLKNKVKYKNQRKKFQLNKKKSFKELKIIRRKIVNKIKANQEMNNKMVIQTVNKENQIIKITIKNHIKTKNHIMKKIKVKAKNHIKKKIKLKTQVLLQNKKSISANRKEKQTNFKKKMNDKKFWNKITLIFDIFVFIFLFIFT